MEEFSTIKIELEKNMQTSEGIIYAEVYTILNMLEEKYNLTIPEEISYLFLMFKDSSYDKKIDVSKPLASQEINEETIDIINKFYNEYWSKDKENSRYIARLLEEPETINEPSNATSLWNKIKRIIFKK